MAHTLCRSVDSQKCVNIKTAKKFKGNSEWDSAVVGKHGEKIED